MSARSVIVVLVIAAFAVLSTLALMDVGYFGILAPHFRSWGGAQVSIRWGATSGAPNTSKPVLAITFRTFSTRWESNASGSRCCRAGIT